MYRGINSLIQVVIKGLPALHHVNKDTRNKQITLGFIPNVRPASINKKTFFLFVGNNLLGDLVVQNYK